MSNGGLVARKAYRHHENMKVDRKTMEAHRAAILEEGSRLFRRHGVGGVAVAEITGAAGLTHGAFYGHFPSKSALAVECCRTSLDDAAQRWRARAEAALAVGRDPIAAIIDAYLSPARRDSSETSCFVAVLGSEASRDADLQPAIADGAKGLIAVLQDLIALRHPTDAPSSHADAALSVFSAMVGGLNLARILSADPDRSDAVLRTAASLARRAAD